MYPTLVKFGSISISSFSVMVLISFFAAYFIAERILIKKGEDPQLADVLMIGSIIGGLGGAKILFIIQNATISEVVNDPMRYLSSGYTFLGGFIGALICIYLISLYKKISFWHLTDICAAPLIIAYAIGRIGCFLVGDDYGVPSDLPWAVAFPNGAPPTIIEVHPTQIYDSIFMFFFFLVLWKLKELDRPNGWLTSIVLIGLGGQRFLIEFIRNTSPSFIEGFSQAQLISMVLVFIGIFKLVYINSRSIKAEV